jgi:hypothetical protein
VKYLCLAYYDERAFDALSKGEFDAIVGRCPAHDEALRKTGRLVVQASLASPRASTVLRPKNGRPLVTDGPFVETKEQVGGFFVIDAADLDEAIRIASNHPAANLGEGVGWAVEIRPIEGYEPSEAGPDVDSRPRRSTRVEQAR